MPVVNVYAEGGGMAEPARHDGEEFVLVLDGRIELTVGDGAPIVLGPGDSAHYRSDVPHSFRNVAPWRGPVHRRHDASEPLEGGDRCQRIPSTTPSEPRSATSSRSSRPRRTSTRARRARSRTAFATRCEEWLAGWDENGAEWDYWVARNEAFRSRRRRPAPRRGGRRRGDDVGLAGRERAALGAPLDGEREPDRDQRVRVPDGGPDRARAGAARRRGRPRASGRGRVDPGRALRRGDRRADGARLLHDALVPLRPPPRRDGDRGRRRTRAGRSCSPTATRRAARSSSTCARSAPTSSRAGR